LVLLKFLRRYDAHKQQNIAEAYLGIRTSVDLLQTALVNYEQVVTRREAGQ